MQWLNGDILINHEIGHLPFEAEISSFVVFGGKNRVTVAVDNSLLKTTVPQGKIVNMESDDGTVKVQTYSFDFFNYAGIHRYSIASCCFLLIPKLNYFIILLFVLKACLIAYKTKNIHRRYYYHHRIGW